MAKETKTVDSGGEAQEIIKDNAGDTNGGGIVDKAWNFLSSMKLGIILLLVIAIVSIVGTIWVPKDQFGRENFTAFYNSFLFRALLVLLALNLLICSLNRWKSIVSTFRGPKPEIAEGFVKNLKGSSSFKVKNGVNQTGERIKGLLKAKGYRVFTKEEDGVYKLSSDKGHWGILGPYLTHLSFIIMIIAIIIKFSGLVGFEGTLVGMVGGTYDLTQVRDVQGKIDLKNNFNIKVNNFRSEYRPDGSVKQWYSDVTVIDNNNTFNYSIYVNNPLVYKGIKFYQMSYGYQFSGKYSGPGAQDQPFTIGMQDYVQPQGTDLAFIPTGFNDTTQKVQLTIYKGNQVVKEDEVAPNTPYQFEQASIVFDKPSSYTVLSVKKDPGVPVVGLGSLLLMAGVIISFILRQRRIWAFVKQEKEGALVQIGGVSAKDRRGMTEDIEAIIAELKQ